LIKIPVEELLMKLINPDDVRLVPGESIHALFALHSGDPGQVGLFIRTLSPLDPRNGGIGIRQRAGLIRFDDVLLVLTLIRIKNQVEEIFDIWWDYYSPGGEAYFRRMAQQERLIVHFYTDDGNKFSIETENSFIKFFNSLDQLFDKSKPWTQVDFDRAVRGFCAQSYPKENLWDMMQLTGEEPKTLLPSEVTADDYPGLIPTELRPFYVYLQDKGHCLNIIPSLLELEAAQGNPKEYLHPAPVKTVLRCGIRWINGLPVAPIPFIPGHGLAVPPDDEEFLVQGRTVGRE
jgi:hypothetical protein